MLKRQVQHMSRIVDDLLDVSRITRGKLSIVRERLDLARARSPSGRGSSRDDRGRRPDARADLPSQSVWVTGDATRFTQLVDNLLDNARKFTPSGGRVTVRITRDAETGAWRVLVDCATTGIGIEPSLLPHVFDVFAQAEQSFDRTRGGLGLGLAVAKGLIELHGGTISASSAGKGRGAEFTIRDPDRAEAGGHAHVGRSTRPGVEATCAS